MVHSILEEDQAHGLAAGAVVICQVLLQRLDQLGVVNNLHTDIDMVHLKIKGDTKSTQTVDATLPCLLPQSLSMCSNKAVNQHG